MENSELETLKIKYDELAKQLEERGVSFDHHTAVKTMMEMKLTHLRADLDLARSEVERIKQYASEGVTINRIFDIAHNLLINLKGKNE